MTDLDVVVLVLPRGQRGEQRISRATYKGSEPYTKIQFWFPADDSADAELKPGKAVTLKDGELRQVIATLIAIDRKATAARVNGSSFTETTPPTTPARALTRHRNIRADEASDEGLF